MGNIGNKLFQFSKSGPGDALSKFYSPFSCGSHFVPSSRTTCTILKDGSIENICVKYF